MNLEFKLQENGGRLTFWGWFVVLQTAFWLFRFASDLAFPTVKPECTPPVKAQQKTALKVLPDDRQSSAL